MVFKGLIPSKSICSLNLQINKLSKLCFFWEKVCLWLDEKFVPGMMRMGLLKSSPNFQRLDMDIPVLLFLAIRWGQKKETFAKPVKAFVVAGGHEGSHTSSSVLMLLHGASSWTPVASLPGILYQARASVVGGNMRVTGGRPGPPGGNTEVRDRRVMS